MKEHRLIFQNLEVDQTNSPSSTTDQEAGQQALEAAQNTIQQAVESAEANTNNTTVLANKPEIISSLSNRRIAGSENLITYVSQDPTELTPEIKLALIRAIKTVETNPNLTAQIDEAERIFALQTNLPQNGIPPTEQEIASANETLDGFLNQLTEFNALLQTTRAGLDETMGDVTGWIANGAMQLRENVHRMPSTHKAILIGSIVVGFLWTFTSGSPIAKTIRAWLGGGAKIAAGIFAVNVLLEALTGKSITEGLEYVNRHRSNQELSGYFGLDYDDENEEKYADGLLNSLVYDEEISTDRTFPQMINAYQSSKRANTESMPIGLVRNSESFNSVEGRVILYHAVEAFYKKFGPESTLYGNSQNPEMKNTWDRLMASTSPWQQALDLMIADPGAPAALTSMWFGGGVEEETADADSTHYTGGYSALVNGTIDAIT